MIEAFDVVVVGGGINGAAVCHDLTRTGYRVLLAEQGDFGSGTSPSSTMLIWGGLLYLKDLEFATVLALTRDRDRLVAERPGAVQARELLYVPSAQGRPRIPIQGALEAYWMLSAGRRARPRHLTSYDEQALLARDDAPAYAFEEAVLVESDARFVLDWILDAERLGAVARNYTRVEAIVRAPPGDGWRVGLCDALTGATSEVAARLIVNAAGCWTDGLNARARIQTPFRHAFSRGVTVAVPRDPRHQRHLVFDTDRDGNAMTLAPWGPVSLWGSTDTLHPHFDEAKHAASADVSSLLCELNRHLRTSVVPGDVVSVRVGVRPVPVSNDAPAAVNGSLTRHHRLHLDGALAWVSIYGGKLSGCVGLAAEVRALVAQRIAPSAAAPPANAPSTPVGCDESEASAALAAASFPTLADPVVSPSWAVAHEHCCWLEDYLRRRTNIAQWVPSGGFGRHFEHADELLRIATEIHDGDLGLAERDLDRYWTQVYDGQCLVDAAQTASVDAAQTASADAAPRESATRRWRRP